MGKTCDVDGCQKDAAAKLYESVEKDEGGDRCLSCLRFDLGL